MSSTPEFSQEQLAAARASAWKQTGEPLLTLEAARSWVNEFGLMLFAPRPQLAVPAPSLVEATLGASNGAPTLAQISIARGLLSRLLGEGLALPLNLLGGAGDSPDFVVSAQVFSYVFTMRGDKLWKQLPSTSDAVKVSPLGLRVYEVLTERGALTAMQLAAELGREVTEAAIVRALDELWAQLRVIPLLSQEGESQAGGSTLWELTTRRFTKAIKAGANAGQPTALSALVSLYLAQVFAATEDEVATFLSPLTARSRVREVLHALVGARQLDTVTVEGRTLLHIPGTLPEFATAAAAAEAEDSGGVQTVAVAEFEPAKKVGTGRISSFNGDRRKTGELRGKPARSFGGGADRSGAGRSAAGASRSSAHLGARADGKADRERRPFNKSGAAQGAPSFAKPWNEAKPRSGSRPWNQDRPARTAAPGAPDSFTKFRRPAAEVRQPLGPREQAGLPPERRSAQTPRPERRTFERVSKPDGFLKRPYAARAADGGERSFTKSPYQQRRTEGSGRGSFSPHSLDRGAKPGGFGAKRAFTPSGENGERARYSSFNREAKPGGFAGKPPYTAPPAEDSGRTLPKRPYKPRAADAASRTFTKAPWSPSRATGAARESSGGDSRSRPYRPRGEAGTDRTNTGPRKTFTGRPTARFTGKPTSGRSGSETSGAKFGGGSARPASSSGGAKRAGAAARSGRPVSAGARLGGKPAGFRGAKQSGTAGGVRPGARRKPEAEE